MLKIFKKLLALQILLVLGCAPSKDAPKVVPVPQGGPASQNFPVPQDAPTHQVNTSPDSELRTEAISSRQSHSNLNKLPHDITSEFGFRKLSDPQAPGMLHVIAESVFEIRTVFQIAGEAEPTVDLTNKSDSAISESLKSITDLDAKEIFILKHQIANCRAKKRIKHCPLLSTFNRGTGFLAGGDGRTLWTNAHVVNHYLKYRTAAVNKTLPDYLKSDARVATYVFDRHGKLVFDPYKDSAVISESPLEFNLSLGRKTWFSEDTDFVKITLSKKLGPSLAIGSRAVMDQKLFVLGFPACTGCSYPGVTEEDKPAFQDRGAGLNSDGVSLYWTTGSSLAQDTATKFYGVDLWRQYDFKRMIVFSADSHKGMSGGPILNSHGQVVGLHAGSKIKPYNLKNVIVSRGVRPNAFNLIEK